MTQVRNRKINHLLQIWPKGTVATSCWLSRQGIRFDLVARYKKTGWVESLGHGAFRLSGDSLSWQGAIYSLQCQLGLSTHPAGKTALVLSGRAHTVPMSDRDAVVLFSSSGEWLPKWFIEHNWNAEIRHVATNLFPHDLVAGFTKVKNDGFEIAVSSAERAIMEFLFDVPEKESLEEAFWLFEGLMTLQPDVVSLLLKHCSSVKAKRLFMVLAEYFKYPWVAGLDVSSVDFGRGKRMLVAGGFLHPKYQIMVPNSWKKTGKNS